MPDDPMLNESREWTGNWWFPDAPDDRVPGVLAYEPDDGLMLRLIGGWEFQRLFGAGGGSRIVREDQQQEWSILHGLADGKLVTLVDCLPVGSQAKITSASAFTGRPDTQSVRASGALIGCHLGSIDEPAFSSGIVTVENLTTWSQRGGIELRLPISEDEDKLLGGGEVHLDRIDALEADLGGVKVRLHIVSTLPHDHESRSGRVAQVTERASVEFAADGPRTMEEMLDLLSGVSDLVSLATLSACGDITVRLFLPSNAEPGSTRLGPEVAVYENRILKPQPDAEAAGHRDFIMTMDDIEFADLMPRWIEVRERFSAARAMVLGLRYVTEGYLETRVVTAVAAAEAMHRALDLPSPLPKADFRAAVKAMRAAVPEQLRNWASDRMPRNEPTLRERMLDLAERPGVFMAEFIPNPAAWAAAAVKARNNLAHRGTSDQHTTEELAAVVDITSAVVALNLLAELGVPEDRMHRALRVHRGLSWAAKQAKEHFPA